MISRLSLCALVATAAGVALAQYELPPMSSCAIDSGNGVHVPGAVPANVYEPLQHRLSYAGADGMTVSWSTFVKLDQPEVWCE